MSNTERPAWAQKLDQVDFELAMRNWFTVKAAAAYLQVSRSWIYAQAQSKRLAYRKVGKRHLFSKADLDGFMPPVVVEC